MSERVYMKGYKRGVTATTEELVALEEILWNAGYVIREVPQNEWQLFAVDRGLLTGGVYINKSGEISMPEEIYEYLEQEVRGNARLL